MKSPASCTGSLGCAASPWTTRISSPRESRWAARYVTCCRSSSGCCVTSGLRISTSSCRRETTATSASASSRHGTRQQPHGTRQRPVMLHRALFGSIERFFGVLTEHYAGAFPPWLAPVQAIGIPITEAHVSYLHDVVGGELRSAGVRFDVDDSDERMQKKIRNAQKQKVPFMLIAGDDDVAAGAVSFRYRDGTQKNGVLIADALAEIRDAIERRVQV